MLLDITKTNVYALDPVYTSDGADVVGLKVTIEVETIYNPGATSYLRSPSGLPLPTEGLVAPLTDRALRSVLTQPRGRLYYVVGGETVLISPATTATVDVVGGPTPKMVAVKTMTERTWRVVFRIETVINECEPSVIGLVSNRWKQTHHVGPDRLTTVVTRGVSVFRQDALESLGVTADYFRGFCLPRHILDFQRGSITVEMNEIGNVLAWEVVDKERFVSIGQYTYQQYGVVDFDATYNQSSKPAGPMGSISQFQIATMEASARGDRNSTRSGLLTWLSKLCFERLPLNQLLQSEKPGVILRCAAQESMSAPVCSMMYSMMFVPPKVGADEAPGLDLSTMGVDFVELFREGFFTGTNPQMPGGSRGHYRGEALARELRGVLEQCFDQRRPLCVRQVPPVQGNPDTQEYALTPFDYYCNSKPVLNVSVGLPLQPYKETQYKDYEDGQIISEASVDMRHTTQTMSMVAPRAGTGDEPPVVFRLGNPMSVREAMFTVEGVSVDGTTKPPVPSPKLPISGNEEREEVLVGSPYLELAAPELLADGIKPVYRYTGKYTYARTAEGTKGPGDDELVMGSAAYTKFDYDDPTNKIVREDYADGLVNPPSAGLG